MQLTLKLNCDLGEHEPAEAAEIAAAVMPHIDQANIACGVHAGNAVTMATVLDLAKRHGVSVGAHPSYPDRENFGRRSINLPAIELRAHLHYQIAALDGMAASKGIELSYIKPHGALYNDMMRDTAVWHTVCQAVASYSRLQHKHEHGHQREQHQYQYRNEPLPLMIQGTPYADELRNDAEKYGISLLLEAFADRQYTNDGLLLNRDQPGAVLNAEQTVKQAQHIANHGLVTCDDGTELAIHADSLCVHGDHSDSIANIVAIRTAIKKATQHG